MKLYATIDSNRAQKGQGGDFLNIEITDGHKDVIGTIHVRQRDDGLGDINYITVDFAPYIYVNKCLWLDSEVVKNHDKRLDEKCDYCGELMYTVVRAHHHTENGQDVTKANKKKDEQCDECGESNFCTDCHGCVYCTKACKHGIDSHNA